MRSFFTSTVGRKYIMAVTGTIWAGFAFVHMAGNLLIFVSADAYNKYGHSITSGPMLYVVEAVLLLSLIPHVLTGIALTFTNMHSKQSRYAVSGSGDKATSFISKTMGPQGLLLLFFIISHLLSFKYGTYYETTVGGVVMRDLHRLIVENFQNPGFVGWYLVSLTVLGLHLSHGVGSVFQSSGLLTKRNQKAVKCISVLYALVVASGFISQPIYVYFFSN